MKAKQRDYEVTTRAVVWIEIVEDDVETDTDVSSPPVRWCGLKFVRLYKLIREIKVTTRAVVWIEIWQCLVTRNMVQSHHPCGCVA